MPELPEVETIRRQLTPLIVGKTISSIEVWLKKSFIGETQDLIGKKIIGIDRKGKVLVIRLQPSQRTVLAGRGPSSIGRLADCNFYIHLRMSGQLQFLSQKESPSRGRTLLKKPPHRHLRIIIHFTDHSQLHFIDQRTFGFIATNPNVVPKGIDALDPKLTVSKLKTFLSTSKKPIKTLLLDQNLIAGIGNIYASEILWDAGINPASKGYSFRAEGVSLKRLHSAIKKILTEAIEYGGSTISDQLYRHVGGRAGGYQKRFKVYDREGEPCLRPACRQAGVKIKKIKLGQRSTYFCPKCQR